MKTNRKKVVLSELGLLLCGIIWGTGFVVMKNSLNDLPINWLIAFRFNIAAVAIGLLFIKKVIKANKGTILAGLTCGVILYLGFLTQTVGLSTTTAGNNAFLTAAYVVAVPFFGWCLTKKKPGLKAVLAACLCFFGVGIIALDMSKGINVGDVWTLVCAQFYALHIVLVSGYTRKGMDIINITAYQFFACAILANAAALVLEPFPPLAYLFVPDTLFALLYLGLMCSLLSLLIQNTALKYAPAAKGSLLMSTEALFGCLAGVIFLNEPITLRFIMGALIIGASIVISELGKKPDELSAPPG